MSCIRTALTYLNSVGPFLANRQYNRHPGRGITTDHLSATISPKSSRCYAPVESSSRSGRIRRRPVGPKWRSPSHARCAVQEFRKTRMEVPCVVQTNTVPRMSNKLAHLPLRVGERPSTEVPPSLDPPPPPLPPPPLPPQAPHLPPPPPLLLLLLPPPPPQRHRHHRHHPIRCRCRREVS